MPEGSDSSGASHRLTPAPLPRPLSSFIGRRAEIEELTRLLGRARLLTLVGPPGCGKTRLALEVAAANAHRFPGGVAFVDLATVRDPVAVPDAAAAALGLEEQSLSCSAMLGSAHLLFVIDNAEHLLDAVCPLVEQLLTTCPDLCLLVTSRESLNLDGEVCWYVEPLPVPSPDMDDVEAVRRYDSVRLLCARAAEHRPSFRITQLNFKAIAIICRRLDGIPLAIELAAARVPALGPSVVAARMSDSFRILTAGRRTADSRHRTIRAAIQWSYELLDVHEQTLLTRLTQFAGTFDLVAAESVCADVDLPERRIAEALSGLINKSLLVVHPKPDGELRYSQLEIIRQFGREHIGDIEAQKLSFRHASYYAGIADAMSVAGGDFDTRVEAMTAAYPNIEVALDWAARRSPAKAAAMTENLHWYWMLRGMMTASMRHFESALSSDGVDRAAVARLCILASTIAHFTGDYAAMSAYLERASNLAVEIADLRLDVWVTASRGLLAAQQEDWSAVVAWCRQLVDLSKQLPESQVDGPVRMHGWPPSRGRHMMLARNNLAMALLQLGRNDEALCEAQRAVEEAATLFERSIPMAPVLETCGLAYLALARTGEARERFLASLDLAVTNANDRFAVPPLLGLARVAAMDGDYASFLTLAEAARRAARLSGTTRVDVSSSQVELIAELEETSRTALGEKSAEAAGERGASMDIRAALEFARRHDAPRHTLLSAREGEIAELVAHGLTDKEIANRLSLSRRTVEVHLASARRKLRLRNRAEVAAWVAWNIRRP